MIRAFILLLAVLAGGWLVADSMKNLGPGYVLVYFNHYSLETSVWIGSLLLFLAVLICYLLIRVAAKLLQFARFTGQLKKGRQRQWFDRSVSSMLQEDYDSAKRYALRNKQFEDFILAGRAALAATDVESARECLKKAANCEKLDIFSLSLLHYDIALSEGDQHEMDRLLPQLQEQNQQHIAVLKRTVQHYINRSRFKELQQLIEHLQKKQKGSHQALQKVLLMQAANAVIAHAVTENNPEQLQQVWQRVAKTAARNHVLPVYCKALISLKQEKEAEKLLFSRLRNTFDEACLVPYAMLSFDAKEQLEYLQTMDESHPYNAKLQLALAVLMMQQEEWESAKQYLDKSLLILPSREAYQYLAEYYQATQQLGLALNSMQKAMQYA